MSNSREESNTRGFITFRIGILVTKSPTSSDQLRPLTSLRFFAAVVVLIAHSYHLSGGNANEIPGYVQLASGVTFFFVLSGFILTFAYLTSLQKLTLRGSWNFYVARIARIWPVHLLTLAILLPFFLPIIRAGEYGGPIGDPIVAITTNACLIQTFMVKTNYSILNFPSWSLSAELFFYLCFPFLIWSFASRSIVRRSIVLLLVLTPWLLAMMHWMRGAPVNAALARFNYYLFPPVRIADFVAGMMLGFAWHSRHRVQSAVRFVTFRQGTLIEIGAVLILIGWACLSIRLAPGTKLSNDLNWSGGYVPPFLLCIWVFACGRGLLSRLLSTRLFVYLGEISFGVYMFHIPVMLCCYRTAFGTKVCQWALKSLGWQGGSLLVAFVSIVLSAVCYHLYEMPMRNLLRRMFSIRKPIEPVVQTALPAIDSMNPESIVRRAA
jgi:peptidoglycan/LPS O-acetylase OafA/YrhL